MLVLIVLCFAVECVCCLRLMSVSYFSKNWVNEWPPIGKIAAHSEHVIFLSICA